VSPVPNALEITELDSVMAGCFLVAIDDDFKLLESELVETYWLAGPEGEGRLRGSRDKLACCCFLAGFRLFVPFLPFFLEDFFFSF
jgi:hypothetical protein